MRTQRVAEFTGCTRHQWHDDRIGTIDPTFPRLTAWARRAETVVNRSEQLCKRIRLQLAYAASRSDDERQDTAASMPEI
jgi:hypothetical protein